MCSLNSSLQAANSNCVCESSAWKTIRPRLEKILRQRRERRIEDETEAERRRLEQKAKAERQRLEQEARRLEEKAKVERSRRRNIIRECVGKIVIRKAEIRTDLLTTGRAAFSDPELMKDIAVLTAENTPSFFEHPNLQKFLVPGGPEPDTKRVGEIWDAAQIDVRALEPRFRETLAQLIRRSEGSLPTSLELQRWHYGETGLSQEELEAKDADNLNLLLKPSSIFLVDRDNACSDCRTSPCALSYPAVLEHIQYIDASLVTNALAMLRPVVMELMAQLESYDEAMCKTTKGTRFQCQNCSCQFRSWYSWIDLVSSSHIERFVDSNLMWQSGVFSAHPGEARRATTPLALSSGIQKRSASHQHARKRAVEGAFFGPQRREVRQHVCASLRRWRIRRDRVEMRTVSIQGF